MPDGIDPLVMTPLGYPAKDALEKKRKAIAELVREEGW